MKKILFTYFAPKNSAYIPLDIGFIVANIQKQKLPIKIEVFPLTQEFYGEKTFENQALQLFEKKADTVFFFLDNIIWSRVFCLEAAKKIAKEIQKYSPQTEIGVQSYKITQTKKQELLKDKNFDFVIQSDPENEFLKIIQESDNFKILSYKNLDEIPSPYLSHILDETISEQIKTFGNHFQVFLQTSRGCPFGCYYCFRSVKFENMQYFSVTRIFDEIEYLLEKFGLSRFFIIDDCFITSSERLKSFVSEFETRKKKNLKLEKIRIGINSRPEFLSEENIQLLAKLNVESVQIGLQSTNKKIEKFMTRNVSEEQWHNVAKNLEKQNIPLHLDIILGLPGDDAENAKKTIDFALSLKPFSLQIKQLYHNPFTKFDEEKEALKLEIEEKKRFFFVPYIQRAQNIDKNYFSELHEYVEKQKQNFPSIQWHYLSELTDI